MNNYFENKIRVRYAETDQMGFVYYGNYPQYLEVARTELIRSVGVSYKELEEQGIRLPVVNLNISYRRPAKYDDILTLKTFISGEISKKICFETTITNELNQVICNAKVEMMIVSIASGKVMTCPSDLVESLSQYR